MKWSLLDNKDVHARKPVVFLLTMLRNYVKLQNFIIPKLHIKEKVTEGNQRTDVQF